MKRCARSTTKFVVRAAVLDVNGRALRRLKSFVRSRAGGWKITRCSARCTSVTSIARGGRGIRRCRRASRPRSIAPALNWPTRFATTSSCSGWPPISGARRVRRARRSGSLAICRSWLARIAPTCGRIRRCSRGTCRSARRRMRSARPARTGACPRIAGMRSPRRIFAGCAIAPAARASCSTASASIT